MIDRLLNQGAAPVLEQVARFAAQRHRLIAENIANLNTAGYRQRDLSVEKFQGLLARSVEERRRAVGPRPPVADVATGAMHPTAGILCHDGNNRSAEQLATDLARNAMMHNVAIELLRRQYQSIEGALKERVV